MHTLRHTLTSVVAAVTLCLPIGITTALAQEGPDPDTLYFHDEIAHGGSACPQGSLDAAVSEDGMAISILFDENYAEVGPDTPPVVIKSCTLSLPLHIPPGWQYSLIELDYRGYLFLERRVRARQRSEYYFQGRRGPRFQSRWQGPEDRDYDFTDTIGLATSNVAWSPCNLQRNLTIKTQLRLDNIRARNNYGFISTDTIDGEIVHIYGLVWRRCQEGIITDLKSR